MRDGKKMFVCLMGWNNGQRGHNPALLFNTTARVAGCEAVSLVCVGILCLRGGGEFEPVFAESAPDCFSERINNSALISYFTFYFYTVIVSTDIKTFADMSH